MQNSHLRFFLLFYMKVGCALFNKAYITGKEEKIAWPISLMK